MQQAVFRYMQKIPHRRNYQSINKLMITSKSLSLNFDVYHTKFKTAGWTVRIKTAALPVRILASSHYIWELFVLLYLADKPDKALLRISGVLSLGGGTSGTSESLLRSNSPSLSSKSTSYDIKKKKRQANTILKNSISSSSQSHKHYFRKQ